MSTRLGGLRSLRGIEMTTWRYVLPFGLFALACGASSENTSGDPGGSAGASAGGGGGGSGGAAGSGNQGGSGGTLSGGGGTGANGGAPTGGAGGATGGTGGGTVDCVVAAQECLDDSTTAAAIALNGAVHDAGHCGSAGSTPCIAECQIYCDLYADPAYLSQCFQCLLGKGEDVTCAPVDAACAALKGCLKSAGCGP